jgi:hypothetical protein
MLYARVPTPWNPNEKPKAQIVSGIEPVRITREVAPPTVFRLEERRPDAEFISNSQYVQPEGKPIQLRARDVLQRKRVFIPFGDRGWDLASNPPPDQVADTLDRQEFKRLRKTPKQNLFYFEERPLDFGQVLDSSQDVVGVWDYEPWKLVKRGKQRIYFRFEDRRWNIAFERDTQIGSWNIKCKTWYAIPDKDYFPPRLKEWLRGRCFMMVRLRSGAGLAAPTTPANGYITEDGQLFYITEDGSAFYVQES